MTSEPFANPERTAEILERALALPEEERSAYLDSACSGDEGLRAELESLLAAHARLGRFLAGPSRAVAQPLVTTLSEAGTTSDHREPLARTWDGHGRESPGQVIDRYKLLELLGEGGFGSVWMAEQREPVKRRVALKIIKLGMDTRQVVARFEAERQALAVMDHPNIAKVLDAGATETGRPFFVMELVKGEALTRYCDRHQHSISQRLELFVQVCKAVQHAHQKGIIHRDLKPGNILVSTQDGRPHAKVIDFGIAKAISRQLTEKTLFTEHRQLIGTPEYMSPEQAEGSLDIDTRTDVYSLGVLLYMLLTGNTPFDGRSLRSAAYAEIQRIIREVEPPRPSTRLSQSADTLASVAARRQVDPRKLSTMIRGELDWIVMKCLEKDRQRRYETANGLALDIERYLAGEAVTAAPPSRIYKIRKVVRKHKGPFAAGAVVALALVLGVVGTSWGMFSALRQREIAEQARSAEAKQRVLAQESEHRALEAAALAEREAERAEAEAALALAAQANERARAEELEQVAEFQASQLRDIETELMGTRLRGDILSRRQAHLESRGGDEETVAAALQTLSESLMGVNFTNVALRTLEENIFDRALGAIEEKFADQPLVKARLLQTVADTMRHLGLLQRATAPQVEALEIRRSVLGSDQPDTLASISSMGILLYAQGKLLEAEPCFRESLAGLRRALGDEHPSTLVAIGNMGGMLRDLGRFAEAEPHFREALETSRRLHGDDHSGTLYSVKNMASLLRHQGRLEEAEPYHHEALEICRRVHGDEHPDTFIALNDIGVLLWIQGKPIEAEPYFRESSEGLRRVFGDEHPSTLHSIANVGAVLNSLGRRAEAEPYFLEALETSRRLHGDEHSSTLRAMGNMGGLLRDQGKFNEAEPYHQRAMEISRRVLGDEHPDTLASILQLGVLRFQQGLFRETISLLEPVEPLVRSAFSAGLPWRLVAALSTLGRARVGLGYDAERFSQAETELLEAYAISVSERGAAHLDTRSCVQGLVDLYTTWNAAEPDAGHDARAEQWRSRVAQSDPPSPIAAPP